MSVGSEGEKSLGHLERSGAIVVAVAPHRPLAVASDAMRVNGQQFSDVITRSPADLPQGDLQPLRFGHGVLRHQAVYGHVAGNKGESIG